MFSNRSKPGIKVTDWHSAS